MDRHKDRQTDTRQHTALAYRHAVKTTGQKTTTYLECSPPLGLFTATMKINYNMLLM